VNPRPEPRRPSHERHHHPDTIPAADLITHRLPLANVLDAIATVESGEAIKVTIEP